VSKESKKSYYRDDVFLKALGENIRRIRLENGLTQTELAFECDDKDYSQINRVELGKVNFSVSHLYLIAQALHVKVKEIMPDL